MRVRALRIVILLWMGWYLTGPLAETVDRWDGPRQEIHDILFNAGGGVTLVACAFSLAVLQARKLRERCSQPLGTNRLQPFIVALLLPSCLPFAVDVATRSSPPPLRI
jgi:hypothetical protein